MRLEHFRALKLHPESHGYDYRLTHKYDAGKRRGQKRTPPTTLSPDFYRNQAVMAVSLRNYEAAAYLLGMADGVPGNGLVFTVPGLPDPIHDEAPSDFKLGRK